MPLTVITLKNVPPSLKGDLSKWMQEIATGVYVGNFNSRIRERLWERVIQNVNVGEATLSFACRNEIGYSFQTFNTKREVIDSDGIPLVLLPMDKPEFKMTEETELHNFSNARKFRNARKFSSIAKAKNVSDTPRHSYIAIDIETDGLDSNRNSIIEIAAVKQGEEGLIEFSTLVSYDGNLPDDIVKLTGITDDMLHSDGISLSEALSAFTQFIGDADLVGFNINFDVAFMNSALVSIDKSKIKNKTYDLMRFIKREKMFLPDYKLTTCLREYGLSDNIPHRALEDAKAIYSLSTKVNEFLKNFS